MDESSLQSFKDEVKLLEDPVVKEKLASTKKLADVSADDYDAVFYVGGHGPMIDLADNPENDKLASEVSPTSCLHLLEAR